MFDKPTASYVPPHPSDQAVGEAKPPPRPDRSPLGVADRRRLVDYLGGRYFAMRHARRSVGLEVPHLMASLDRGGPIPPRVLDALYRYDLARVAWRTGYRTLMTLVGAEAVRLVWEEIRDRYGGADSETDVPAGDTTDEG